MDFRELIVSTPETCTFIHRCSETALQKILKQGVKTGPDIRSTATFQSPNLEIAENLYRNGTGYGNRAVVIQIPTKVWLSLRERAKFIEVTDPEIGYFHPEEKDYFVHLKYVVAWIDRTTDRVHPVNHHP